MYLPKYLPIYVIVRHFEFKMLIGSYFYLHLDDLSSFNYLLNERRSLEEERQQPVGGCCFLSEFPSHSGPSPHTIFFGLASN